MLFSNPSVFPFEFLKKKETVFIGVSALSGSLSFSRLRHQGTGTKLYPNSIQEYIQTYTQNKHIQNIAHSVEKRGNEKTSVNTASNLKCTKDSAYKKLVQARMLESKEQQPHDEWTLVTRRKAVKR